MACFARSILATSSSTGMKHIQRRHDATYSPIQNAMWNQEPEEGDCDHTPTHCRNCGRSESSDAPLSECGTCGGVVYCSFDCLKADWPSHQNGCNIRAGRLLLRALIDEDQRTVQRLVRHKRVVNARVTYTVPPPSDDDGNIITSRNPSRSLQEWTTPLHECVRTVDLASVKLLLEHGANANAVNDKRETPLLLAATQWTTMAHHPSQKKSLSAIVQALLEAGADPNLAAHNGLTANLAAQNHRDQSDQLVQLLQVHSMPTDTSK